MPASIDVEERSLAGPAPRRRSLRTALGTRARVLGGVGCLALACGGHGSGTGANGGTSALGGSSGATGSGASSGGAVTSAGGAQSAGGTAGAGGASMTSGGAPATTGGVTATGGVRSADGGAAPGSGGSTVSTGGVPATGGTSATNGGRGTMSSGGTALTGGTWATGGALAMDGGASGEGGKNDAPGCPRYDASHAPAMLALTGNLGTHDPALIAADGKYYLFQTGHDLPTKTSSDLAAWQGGSAVFSSNPSWIAGAVPGATDLWAPDISNFGGSYHLYYAASTFGQNTSCIGHATRASLAAGSWTDHGSVLCSASGDDFNAIDPNVIVDDAGTAWLAFGSFWNGIQIVELDATGALGSAKPKFIASRPSSGGALEGAFIVRACGYYYLFTSWDHCCDSPWNYNIRVGRSTNVTGPYADKSGKALLDGGGTGLVAGNGTWTAPGHNAVLITPNGAYNVYHALDASHANPTLRVAELAWDTDGWPVSAGP